MTSFDDLIFAVVQKCHEIVDDTLVNRFCRSLFCRHGFHQERLKEYSDHCDSHWRSLLRSTYSCTTEFDPLRMVPIKILTALVISNPKCSNESLEIVKQMLRIEYLLPTLLELTSYCLIGVRTLDDLSLFKKLFTEDICKYLLNTLHKTSNIHTKRLITITLAHSALLGTYRYHFTEDRILHEEDITLLLMEMKLYRKFTVKSELTVEIPVSLIQRALQDQVQNYGAQILFLVCANGFHIEESALGEFTNFLTNLTSWTHLCAQTICVYLRHGIPLSSPLWNMVLTSWSDEVNSFLVLGHFEELNRLIKPICGFARSRCTRSIYIPCENLHNLLVNAAGKVSTRDSEIRCNIWYLLSIIVTPMHADMLEPISERLYNLVSDVSHQDAKELEAVLYTAEKLCDMLTDTEKVIGFVERLIHLSGSSSDPQMSFLLFRHGVHICSSVGHKLRENDVLKTAQNCVMQCLNIVSERLCTIYEKDQDTVEEIGAYSSMNFHSEQYMALTETLFKVATEQEVFSSFSSNKRKFHFIGMLGRLADSSVVGQSGFYLSNELRILFICALAHCIASILADQPALMSDEDGFSIEQAWTTFNSLIKFDPTDLFGYSSATDNLIKAQEKLSQIKLSGLSKLEQRIAQGMKEQIDLVIHSLDDLRRDVEPVHSCPECCEAPDQLIRDIMTTRSGDMVQDCVEG